MKSDVSFELGISINEAKEVIEKLHFYSSFTAKELIKVGLQMGKLINPWSRIKNKKSIKKQAIKALKTKRNELLRNIRS